MSVDSPAAQPLTPDSLIEQCLAGDQVAWELIVKQNWRKVFNVAYKFVGKHDEAEDLTQDIFLKISRWPASTAPTDLDHHQRNLCIDHYRSVQRATDDRPRSRHRRPPAGIHRSGPSGGEHQDRGLCGRRCRSCR
jgi:RNA polymerase sigma-70 factor (ECF subfamily)